MEWVAMLLALGCSGEQPKAEEQRPTSTQPRPYPELRLIEYEGSMCPEGSLGFSSSDGAATLTTSTDQIGDQECRILIELTLPAGYRFRRPIVHVAGWALKTVESTSSARVSMRYSLGGATVSSEHDVPGLPLSSLADMAFLLKDTPDLQVPECDDPMKPSTLAFEAVVEVEIPDDHFLHISALDWQLVDGVRWSRCDEEL
jgi:hypothetical protein